MRPVSAVIAILCALALSAESPAVSSGGNGVTALDPDAYQSFVGNWTLETKPLCAVLQSAEQWSYILHPAAVMHGNKTFAPPPSLWNGHAILLFARTVSGGETNPLAFVAVMKSRRAIELDVKLSSSAPSSYQMKRYVAVAVDKPLPEQVRFVENGVLVCSLGPVSGNWVSPPLPQ
jgi:hypothetical protein